MSFTKFAHFVQKGQTTWPILICDWLKHEKKSSHKITWPDRTIFHRKHLYKVLSKICSFCYNLTKIWLPWTILLHSDIHLYIGIIILCFSQEPYLLIFGTEHHYRELYSVRHFWICSLSASGLPELRPFLMLDNFYHFCLRNHTGYHSDIWHRSTF